MPAPGSFRPHSSLPTITTPRDRIERIRVERDDEGAVPALQVVGGPKAVR